MDDGPGTRRSEESCSSSRPEARAQFPLTSRPILHTGHTDPRYNIGIMPRLDSLLADHTSNTVQF